MHLLIFGAGAQGRVALDIARASDPGARISFVDEDQKLWGHEVDGACVLEGMEALVGAKTEEHRVVIAVGEPPARLALATRFTDLGLQFANVVHPSAVIAPSARIGNGNVIGAGAVVDTGTTVGDHCIVNAGVVVSHDCTIGNGVLLGPGVAVGGRVTLGDATFLAIGVNVVARVTIGDGAVVGATSTVVEDVAPRVMVMGTPARLVWPVDEAFDWSRLL